MRFSFSAAVALCASLAACNQDSAASNEQRDTHLGDLRAADPASALPDAGTVSPAGSAAPMVPSAGSVAPPAAAAPNDH